MTTDADPPRVPPPGDEDDALREYGRQLAMDGLLELALRDARSRPAVRRWRRFLPRAGAMAAALLFGVLLWHAWPPAPVIPHVGPVPQADPLPQAAPLVALASGWQAQPTGAPEFQVLAPDRLRLLRGELHLRWQGQAGPAEVTVETPDGTAVSSGTDFFVGTHEEKMTRLTRVLVLAGTVSLITAQGRTTGGPGSLLAAMPEQPPMQFAVTANSEFAGDFYRQLANTNQGQNLFCSPYSVSIALAMTLEGARGATAEQMGKVLRFPEAARHVGGDAQLLPWNTALLHSGLAALQKRFNAEKTGTAEMRAKIDALRKDLDVVNRAVPELEKARKWNEAIAASNRAGQIAGELNRLLSQVDQYELRVVNALWGEQTCPFRKEYLDTVGNFYGTGGLSPVDFRHHAEAARQRINGFVAEQTRQRIQDLLPPRSVDELTRLVLTNAIYFKGEWAAPFDANATKDEDFRLAGGGKSRVPLMHNGGLGAGKYAAFNGDGTYFDTPREIREGDNPKLYPDAGGFTLLEMPYKGGDLSMVLIAPQDPAGLDALEAKLTAENLQAWVGKLQGRLVDAFVPRFKLTAEYKLKPTLQALGMVRAFVDPREAEGAQFDGICAATDPVQKLYIAEVFHKAFVEVNEKGAEAAAATAVVMARPMAMPERPKARPFNPTFRADRPFMFLIRDRQTGSVLFLGRVTNPAG